MPKLSRGRQYKKPPSEFGNVEHIRVSLGKEQQAKRKKRRTQDFEENRKIAADSPCSSVMSQNDELRTKLLQSKEKQMKKKKAQESQKKPPFVVGIVRHRLYSPVSTTNVAPMRKKKTDASARNNSNIKRGITKATEKRLLAKAANAETKQKPSTKTLAEKPSMNGKVKVKEQASFAPLNHKFNPPAGLSNILIESSIENNTFACDNLMETAVQLSVGGNSDSIEAITLRLSFNEEETLDHLPNERTNSTGRLKSNSSAKTSPLGFSLHTEIKRQSSPHKLISIPELSINTEDDVNRRKQDSVCKISGMSDLSHSKRFLEIPTIPIHTSTPFSTDVRSNISNQLTPSLVTLKVNQLYNKSLTLLNDTLSVTPKLTPRKNLVKKSEGLKEESLRMRLIRKADILLDDPPATTKSSHEKLEIGQTSRDSSTKINKSELNSIEAIYTEGSSDSETDGFNQTVIEKLIKKENHTLKPSSRSIDSIITLAKNKRSIKESPSNKNLEKKSLGRSLLHPFLNKIAKSFHGTTSTVNSCSTSREASLIHITRNINSKITPNIDRTSRQCNSNMKRSWDKTIISDSISNVSRKIETRSSNKENTN